jgi:hypothetical protein
MSNEEKKDCKVENSGEDYLKGYPIVQVYSPEQWHGAQAIVMNKVGRDALVSALLANQYVIPVFCSDGEGGDLLLITEPTTAIIDQFHKPYTWDVARDSSRSIEDPKLSLTKEEHDLLQKGEHALVRAPEDKHVVKISIQKYLDWRFAHVSDAEDAFDFIGSFMQYGWKGIQNEYKTVADLGRNGAGHSYLPDFLFEEGFEKAKELYPTEITDCLFPDTIGIACPELRQPSLLVKSLASEIAIVWVE